MEGQQILKDEKENYFKLANTLFRDQMPHGTLTYNIKFYNQVLLYFCSIRKQYFKKKHTFFTQ